MSKLRGQLRFFLILAVGALAVYVFYNVVGRSGSVNTRTVKDSTVLKYHRLAGQVDVKKQYNEDNGQKEGPVIISHDENRPVEDNPGLYRDIDNSDENIENVVELARQDGRDDEGASHLDIAPVTHLVDQQHQPDENTEDKFGRQENSHRKKFSPFISDSEEVEFDMYTEKDSGSASFFAKQFRLVHLDLKGAAPKMSYLEKVIPLFSDMGATGLLIEYEDMFPYDKHLSTLAAKNAYSKEDISKINTLAHKNSLSVIPLIPTFGHMEFVLKGKTYQSLREEDHTPQVISPTNHSRLLIEAMIDQVFKLHPDSKFIHIGCDEVYRLGQGKSKQLIDQGWAVEDIFFSHVKAVAQKVKDLQLQPIMWDDMFRKLDEDTLKKSGLGELVQPMVWKYTQQPQAHLPEDIWSKYGAVFGNVWVASSFKGATGSSKYVTDISHHLENHLNWVEIMKFYGRDTVKFVGVALTGWQRYDHFATLCELLPAAIPSLAVCLQTLKNGYFDQHLHEQISLNLLQCDDLVELRLLNKVDDGSTCKFPGSKIFDGVNELYELRQKKVEGNSVNQRLDGWMSRYNVRHNFSSPGQMDVFKKNVNPVREKLLHLRESMQISLLEIFDKYTTEEFLEVQIDSVVEKLDRQLKLAMSLAKRRDWPRRPVINDEQDDSVDTLKLDNVVQDQGGAMPDKQHSNQILQQNQLNNPQPGGGNQPAMLQSAHEGGDPRYIASSKQSVKINNNIQGADLIQQRFKPLNERVAGNNQVMGGIVPNELFKQPSPGSQVASQGNQIPVQGNQQIQGHQQPVGFNNLAAQGNHDHVQGNQPLQVAQSVQGIPALHGNQPVQGIPALHGNQPVQGILALHGNQPVQGIPGLHGNQPVQGIPGLHGDQPVQGIPALHGNQPVQGIPGLHGNQPVQGIPGLHGNQPVQGIPALHDNQPVQGAQPVIKNQPGQGNQFAENRQQFQQSGPLNGRLENGQSEPADKRERKDLDNLQLNSPDVNLDEQQVGNIPMKAVDSSKLDNGKTQQVDIPNPNQDITKQDEVLRIGGLNDERMNDQLENHDNIAENEQDHDHYDGNEANSRNNGDYARDPDDDQDSREISQNKNDQEIIPEENRN